MEPRLSLNSKVTVGDFTGHVVGISLKNGVELRKESEEEVKTFSFAEIENAVFYDKKISGFAEDLGIMWSELLSEWRSIG